MRNPRELNTSSKSVNGDRAAGMVSKENNAAENADDTTKAVK